jgi:hypothetical protein
MTGSLRNAKEVPVILARWSSPETTPSAWGLAPTRAVP